MLRCERSEPRSMLQVHRLCRWPPFEARLRRAPQGEGRGLDSSRIRFISSDQSPIFIGMQLGAMRLEPALGAARMRAMAENQAPEAAAMIHMLEMRHLVRRDIVEDEGRRQDEAPGIGQSSVRGA